MKGIAVNNDDEDTSCLYLQDIESTYRAFDYCSGGKYTLCSFFHVFICYLNKYNIYFSSCPSS